MAKVYDHWYIRLPDGRVIRARSTKSLRYHVKSGRIPATARVRRSPSEEWMGLEWTAEFTDLIPKSNGAAGRKPASSTTLAARPRSKSLGMRGITSDITGALEATFDRTKLIPAAVLGLFLGCLVVARQLVAVNISWSWATDLAWAAVGLLCACLAAALITQATFVELSRLRPARGREIRAGLGRHTAHLFVAEFVAVGIVAGGLVLLRRLPAWLSGELEWPDAAVAPVLVVRLIWEAGCWLVLGTLPLLASFVVIEECSFARALRDCWRLCCQHFGRLLLLETLAVALGLLLSAPVLVPVLGIDPGFHLGSLGMVARATLALLGGLAAVPFLAYVLVANVFIYLHLRYRTPAVKM